MSAFLFYKPDSNPNRYSRRERFSPRCTKSSGSVQAIASQSSIELSASSALGLNNLADRDDNDLCCKDNAQCPEVQPASNGRSVTFDECTSLLDPSPESQRGRELVGTAMADESHDDAFPQEWRVGDTTSIPNQSTIGRKTGAREPQDEGAVIPASAGQGTDHASFCQRSREAPSNSESQCFSPPLEQEHGQHTLEHTSNDFQPGIPLISAEVAPLRTLDRSSRGDSGFNDGTPRCRNSPHQNQYMLQAGNSYLHNVTASDPNSPISDLPGLELFPFHRSPGSVGAPILSDQGRGIEDESPNPSPHLRGTPVRSMSEISEEDRCTATDDDEVVLVPVDATHEDCTPSADAQSSPRPGRYAERGFEEGHEERSSRLSPNAESQSSHQTNGIGSTTDTTREGDRPVPMSKSRTSTESEKKYVEFSHIEISTTPPRAMQPGIPVTKGHVVDRTCRHVPRSRGPWRLHGNILSIDIREAQRIPISAGTSTFRVLDGQLFQTITLSLGAVDTKSEPAKPPPRVTKKTGVSAARGPLSSEKKRYLVQLKNEGYTWDQISAKFPGRKKENLQAAYYKEWKRLPTQVSQHMERNSSLRARSKRTGNSRSPRSCQVKKTGGSRYNLRPRSDH